ncbi:MAG: M20/M25/M40 family metallo-hydrolase, partial [Deltaproteobacteria bacterium]
TLRTQRDATMDALVDQAEALVADQAQTHGLEASLSYHDVFRHCMNDAEATNLLIAALDAEGITHDENDLPMRASEDFGRFGDVSKSAMFLLGSGVDHPRLHNPDYDFPDDLIAIGTAIFLRALDFKLNPQSPP